MNWKNTLYFKKEKKNKIKVYCIFFIIDIKYILLNYINKTYKYTYLKIL